MTQVDFYILQNERAGHRDRTLCQLVQKIYGLGHEVRILAEGPTDARQLDELLWTFNPNSFIPHEIDDGSRECSAPIRIVLPNRDDPATNVLINLRSQIPEHVDRHDRIVEIIDGDDTQRQAGRDRYRRYQALGLKIETHTLG
ncbi:MAG: DNA polymerase III subunit chi [Gammaproteobacteria bacterium]|nr:DNA polymerase III subunit chi [Gammaproteobacteria bacterium]